MDEVGTLIKGVTKTEGLVDGMKTMDKTIDTAKTIENVSEGFDSAKDGIKTFDHVSDGIDSAEEIADGTKAAKNSIDGVDSTEAVVKRVDETVYQYNMIENPGTLADIPGNPASNFAGGKYNTIVLEEDTILYRGGKAGGGKNALGQWFTETPAESAIQVRIDSAVKPQWIDPKTGVLTGTSPIQSNYTIKIPAGTTIYKGPVGYQGGSFLGGQDKLQIFVEKPWLIDGVEAISETPFP